MTNRFTIILLFLIGLALYGTLSCAGNYMSANERPEGSQIPLYFPQRALSENQDKHDFFNNWFSQHLKKMDEPILSRSIIGKPETYRFLWLRTFHAPICIRINVGSDASSTLSLKVTNGAGGYGPGEIVKNHTIVLKKDQLQKFLLIVDSVGFWKMSSSSAGGLDGSRWILEGVSENTYRVVHTWSPDSENSIRKIGMLMMELANHTEEDVY